MENVNYFLVNDYIWFMLVELHGGGPPISLKYEKEVTIKKDMPYV